MRLLCWWLALVLVLLLVLVIVLVLALVLVLVLFLVQGAIGKIPCISSSAFVLQWHCAGEASVGGGGDGGEDLRVLVVVVVLYYRLCYPHAFLWCALGHLNLLCATTLRHALGNALTLFLLDYS